MVVKKDAENDWKASYHDGQTLVVEIQIAVLGM
jgi:hypothetical protein